MKGEHKGKVRINREVAGHQLWRVELAVRYRGELKEKVEHIISPAEPCCLSDISDIAFESVHELITAANKVVHDADMKFFVLPIKDTGLGSIL